MPRLSLPDRLARRDRAAPDAAEKLWPVRGRAAVRRPRHGGAPGFAVTNAERARRGADLLAAGRHPAGDRAGRGARPGADASSRSPQRLDDRFRLLTGGSRTALPRQQTLRALIDWSYDLLTEPERTLLRRLSVFAGGRTLEAVEAVCSDDKVQDWEVIDLITSLLDKSLVTIEKKPGEEPRYTLLESVWNYGREKLAEAGESDELRKRHLGYFLGIARAAEPHLEGPDQFKRLDQLAPDAYNFRFALDASLEVPGCAAEGLELATALGRYWEVRSLLAESQEIFVQLLAHPDNAGPTQRRAAGLAVMGRMDWLADRTERGARFTREALEIFRSLGEERSIAAAAAELALYQLDASDLDEARQLIAESEEIAIRLGDKRLLAMIRRAQAIQMAVERQFQRALELNEESYALYVELGDRWFAGIVQWGIGVMATLLGDFEKARSNFRDCLRNAWDIGNRWAAAYPLEAFAALAVSEGQLERAARLLGAAEALRSEFGLAGETSDHPALREIFSKVTAHFTRPELVAARKEGRAMSAQAAVAFALEGTG